MTPPAPLLLLLLAASPSASSAQAAGRTPGAPRVPLAGAFTISGGVSLGAYEAGALYQGLESIKARPGVVDLKLVTGASAGALNGLLSILSYCGEKVDDPRESLFWRTWVPLGFDQLFVPEDAGKLSALSTRAISAAATDVEYVWERGLAVGCDVVLGVTVTHGEARSVRTAGDRLALDRMEEKVALRIRGRGPGRPPSVRNYADPEDPMGGLLLVTDEEGEVAFHELRDLLLASAAYPVAFPPQPLRHCRAAPTRGAERICLARDARTELFVDGGLLDNTPLRFAIRLAGGGLEERPGGAPGWSDRPNMRRSSVPSGTVFSFLTPDVAEYPDVEFTPRRATTHSLVTLLTSVVGGLVSTARSKELTTLLEEQPELARKVRVLLRGAPAASAPMNAFFGFFERELRAFDFYLGMYDAWRMSGRSRVQLLAPGEARSDSVEAGWRPFFCVRDVMEAAGRKLDGAGPLDERSCAGDDLASLRILLQVSLERLYRDCAAGAGRWREDGVTTSSKWCRHAMVGGEPPILAGVTPLGPGEWRRQGDEDATSYTMRLLAGHRFVFRDLGLDGGETALAMPRIRERLGRVANRVAELQPRDDRMLVTIGARAGMNALVYEAPNTLFHATLGPEFEIGWSGRYWARIHAHAPWLRLAAALHMRGVGDLLSSGDHTWSAALVGGIELQPRRLSSLATQIRFGLRGGYLFADGDNFSTGSCSDVRRDRLGGCSRPVVESLAALTLLEGFRLQLVGEWFPPAGGQPGLWAIAPSVGIEWSF